MSPRPATPPTVRARSRVPAALALAAAVTVALPAAACAQSSIPGSSSGSLGSAAPLPPGPEVTTERVLGGLSIPWDVVRDPTGVVVTGERGSGTIHAVRPDGRDSVVAADLGPLVTRGESGLMGIALAADFATSREVYTCHSHAGPGRAAEDNRVTAWRAADDWSRLESPRVIVDGILMGDVGRHSGCRILAHPDGTLYIGTGDAFTGPAPQDLGSLSGKVLHVTRTGEPAADTIGGSRVLNHGHRNVQGLALQPRTGRIFSAEHGPDTDDEINLVVPGGNYGWDPNDNGRYDQSVPMTDLRKFPDAVPAVWSSGAPTLAPSGIAFLDDPAWGEWNGALAVAMLKTQKIVLLRLSDDARSVTDTAVILEGAHGRLRSITAGPGGSLLVTTSNGNGRDEVLRVRPA